jgi:hypothetical protein
MGSLAASTLQKLPHARPKRSTRGMNNCGTGSAPKSACVIGQLFAGTGWLSFKALEGITPRSFIKCGDPSDIRYSRSGGFEEEHGGGREMAMVPRRRLMGGMGQVLVEYGLLLAIIAMGAITALIAVKDHIGTVLARLGAGS